MRFEQQATIGEAGRDVALAWLAARVGSLVSAAADPHTRAITIWNGSSTTSGGRIEVDLNLQDDAENYELVDVDGEPVPHLWLGDTGKPPTRVDLRRADIPDFEEIMARLGGGHLEGMSILDLSMRVLRDILHIEVTLDEGDGLSRAELAESVRDAQSLADDGGCGRVALTLHRTALLHLAAWISAVPAWGYTTLLVRPRPKGASRARKAAEILPLPADAAPSPRQPAFPYSTEQAGGKRSPLPEGGQAVAGAMHTCVALCAEGVLPPSGSMVGVSPETVTVSGFQWTENAEGAILQLLNESDQAENAYVELLLPVLSAVLIDLGEDRPDEILWEGEPRAAFTVSVPPRDPAAIRLGWYAS